MRALVTGGRGFVGRHLVDHLRTCGDEVVVVDHADGGVDVTDPVAVRDVVAEHRPDAVYHLAGWSDVGSSWADPAGALRLNAVGTLHVLEASRQAGVERVLSVASAEVYGVVAEDELPVQEDAPLRPTSPYAASKVAAEAVAQQAFLGHGLGVVRVRPFNHIGPGQSEHFLAPGLAGRVARAERDGAGTVAVGNLTPRRDLTDVRDVVRAYRLLMEQGVPGEVYNVCSGRDVAVQELADALLARAERPLALEPDPALSRPVDLPVLRGDPGRLQAATGWAPEIPLEQTLQDVLDDLRARVAQETAATEAR
jgi:GDP-4-dehydro-6-deoxy-D-mannose reductase